MNIETQRIYDTPLTTKAFRVLVDRLWPRGVSKEAAHLDLWLKDLAPTDALRKWFGHEPAKWDEFKKRYFRELAGKRELIDQLTHAAKGRKIVLLCGARDIEHNQAVALKQYLELAAKGAREPTGAKA